MSKRRNRKSTPNIPQDILERARQQIAEDQAPNDSEEVVEETPQPVVNTAPMIEVTESAQPVSKARPRRREGLQPARLGEKKIDSQNPAVVRKMLANPTKVVTEAQLRQEYGYVLTDLKSMGLLAAGLILALIVIAQLL